MNNKLMKILILILIYLCCFTGVMKATKQEGERLIIGKENFWMYTLPIEQDSVLSRQLQKRLSGRISTGLYRGYVGTWRLENGKLMLEKVMEMSENGGYQEVDISGIFDAYREDGSIVARWFTGTILARGGKYLYWDNDRCEHQNVYDDPVNLFVAKFLGTPPINVFSGEVKNEQLYIGSEAVLSTPGVSDQPVHVGIRPEGFILKEDGPLSCDLVRLEVMGRDVSIVSTHEKSQNVTIRSIIDADEGKSLPTGKVHFGLKPAKVFLFCTDTEERIRF